MSFDIFFDVILIDSVLLIDFTHLSSLLVDIAPNAWLF